MLKQKQASPLPVEEQVVSIWAGTTGQLDSIPLEDVQRFEADFLDHLRRTKGDLLKAIRETGKFEESTEEALKAVIDDFKKGFQTTDGSSVVPVDPEVEALDAAAVGTETVKVQKSAPKK